MVNFNVPPLETDEEQAEREYLEWGRGTRPEFIAWKYLVQQKKLKEDVDFVFQSSQFGGRQMFGGAVADFYLPSVMMVWRVQGERFHLLETSDRVHDKIQRVRLEEEGLIVIDLWVDDLLHRPQYVLDLAWRGQQVQSAGEA